jgi:hypothetical protein
MKARNWKAIVPPDEKIHELAKVCFELALLSGEVIASLGNPHGEGRRALDRTREPLPGVQFPEPGENSNHDCW